MTLQTPAIRLATALSDFFGDGNSSRYFVFAKRPQSRCATHQLRTSQPRLPLGWLLNSLGVSDKGV